MNVKVRLYSVYSPRYFLGVSELKCLNDVCGHQVLVRV